VPILIIVRNPLNQVPAMYLALRNVANKWTVPPRPWKQALNQFAVLFQDRFPSSIY